MQMQIVGNATKSLDSLQFRFFYPSLLSFKCLFCKFSPMNITQQQPSPLSPFSFRVCNSLFSSVTVTLPQSHTTHSCARQTEEHTETAHLFQTRNWGENSGSHKAPSLLHIFFCPSHARSRPRLRQRTEQRQQRRRCRCPRRPSVVLAVSGGAASGEGEGGGCRGGRGGRICVCKCMEKNVRGRRKTRESEEDRKEVAE